MPAEDDVTEGTTDANSIRPPDLAPDEVRGVDDVLAGWDTDVDASDLARWQVDRPPFPTDLAVLVGANALGAAIGAAVDRRRGRGLVVGAVLGAVTALTARRIWRLDA